LQVLGQVAFGEQVVPDMGHFKIPGHQLVAEARHVEGVDCHDQQPGQDEVHGREPHSVPMKRAIQGSQGC
jgi:hypothetical protein